MTAGLGLRAHPRLIEFFAVCAGLLLLSAAVLAFDLDLRVSSLFHDETSDPSWCGKGQALWDAVYRYGVWPANATAIGAALLAILSIFLARLRVHRRDCLLLVLTLLVGPGLLVNAILKEETGRPRPRDIVEFGGAEAFHPVGRIDLDGEGRAFPSGHASMGFYFTSVYLALRRNRRSGARAGARVALGGSLFAGGLLGLQRIAVGAHFLSDIIWSGGIVYLAALGLDSLLGKFRWATPAPPRPPTR